MQRWPRTRIRPALPSWIFDECASYSLVAGRVAQKSMVAILLFFLAADAIADAGLRFDRTYISLDSSETQVSVVVRNEGIESIKLFPTVRPVQGQRPAPIVASPFLGQIHPGELAVVSFRLTGAPSADEELYVANFEWFASADSKFEGLSHRASLPLIVHPSTAPAPAEPWKRVKLSVAVDGDLMLENPTHCVIHLLPKILLLPARHNVKLPKPYLLPGEILVLKNSAARTRASFALIELQTISGLFITKYQLPVVKVR